MTARLCTICARGGSKGVPNKNIAPILGVPLIAYSIRQARDSGLFDFLAVSSDDPAILAVARDEDVDFLVVRPTGMADDHAGKLPAIRHCVEEVEARAGRQFNVLVDLDATSPLRDVSDIQGAVALLEAEAVSNVITGTPSRRSPYFNMVERSGNGTVSLSKGLDQAVVRRQDAPACYDMNASVYVWRRDAFFAGPQVFYDDTRLFVMPEERSIDIDTPLDLEIVTYLMGRRATL